MSVLTLPKQVTLSVTARHGFVAPSGYLLAAIDYSNQEMCIAANESGDPAMLRSFLPDDQVADYIPFLTESGAILLKDGKPVMAKNPEKDLHTLTSAKCCHPYLFDGKPEYLWVEIAKDGSLIAKSGSSRDYGKRVNFGILYLQTAKAMSEMNYVQEDEAQSWIDKHKIAYRVFHEWSQEVADLSTVRGWSTTKMGRLRWVNY